MQPLPQQVYTHLSPAKHLIQTDSIQPAFVKHSLLQSAWQVLIRFHKKKTYQPSETSQL